MTFSSPTKVTQNNIDSLRQVALAIIYQGDNFLLQLRDNIPTIAYSNHWGLFGGHLELGETPEQALKRELIEEINYAVASPTKFRTYNESNVIRYLYHTPLTVAMEQLVLQEGADLALVSFDTIKQGQCYSAKTDQIHPIGKIHQIILLDFFESELK